MKKSYEVLCTILLILIIGICLLQISGVSASFHERLSERKEQLDDVRITTAYYLTKFRQFDAADLIEIEDDGVYIREHGVVTCIFVEDGALYESTVVEGVKHSKELAFEISKVDSVNLSLRGDLLLIEVTKGDLRRSAAFQFRSMRGKYE